MALGVYTMLSTMADHMNHFPKSVLEEGFQRTDWILLCLTFKAHWTYNPRITAMVWKTAKAHTQPSAPSIKCTLTWMRILIADLIWNVKSGDWSIITSKLSSSLLEIAPSGGWELRWFQSGGFLRGASRGSPCGTMPRAGPLTYHTAVRWRDPCQPVPTQARCFLVLLTAGCAESQTPCSAETKSPLLHHSQINTTLRPFVLLQMSNRRGEKETRKHKREEIKREATQLFYFHAWLQYWVCKAQYVDNSYGMIITSVIGQ